MLSSPEFLPHELGQELDKLRQEVCHLRLQVSCARAADAESTQQKNTAPTVPPVPLPVSRTPVKRVSLPGAVMNKARHLEEILGLGKSEQCATTKPTNDI